VKLSIRWFWLVGCIVCSLPVFAETAAEILLRAEQLRTKDPHETEQILNELQSQQQSLSRFEQDLYRFLKAYVHAFKGEQEQAIEWAESVQLSADPRVWVQANLLLATVNEHRKSFEQAYKYLYQALRVAGGVDDADLQTQVYTVATQLHISVEAFQQALIYADNLLELASTPRQHCVGLVLKVHATAKLQNRKPTELLEQALTTCKEANEELLQHSAVLYVADEAVKTEPQWVKEQMEQRLPGLEKIGYRYAIVQAHFYLASALNQLGEIHQAKQLLDDVYQQSVELNDLKLANQALLQLTDIYAHLQQNELALQAYKKYSDVSQRFFREYKERNLAFHLAQTNFIENENKLAQVKGQNELLRLEREVQSNEKLVAIFAGMAMIALLLLALYVVSIKKRDLHRIANTDFLTRLFNRRHFTSLVDLQLDNRRKTEQHSLILLDIDHFKQLNDQFGHAAGDYVLRQLAKMCQTALRKQDLMARLGGEEFAIFLPGCDADHALKLAEVCRRRIAERKFSFKGEQVQITASFGVAACLPQHSFEQSLAQADEALYMAKADGRNCCRLYVVSDDSLVPEI